MTTTMNKMNIFLLDRDKTRSEHLSRFNGRVCVTLEDIVEATSQANIYSIWISCLAEMTDKFLQATHSIRPVSKLNRTLGNYLMLQPPARISTFFSLDGMFSRVAGGQVGGFLPLEELIEVLAAPAAESQDLFLGRLHYECNRMLSFICSSDGQEPDSHSDAERHCYSGPPDLCPETCGSGRRSIPDNGRPALYAFLAAEVER